MIVSVISTPQYFQSAKQAVADYVDATAKEMDTEPAEFLPFIDGYSEFPGVFAEQGDFFLALIDSAVAGCIGFKKLTAEVCEMKTLWVAADFRGKGLAQQLIESSLESASELGYTVMTLDVLPSRIGAIGLYQKLGFRKGPLSHDYCFEMVGFRRELS